MAALCGSNGSSVCEGASVESHVSETRSIAEQIKSGELVDQMWILTIYLLLTRGTEVHSKAKLIISPALCTRLGARRYMAIHLIREEEQ